MLNELTLFGIGFLAGIILRDISRETNEIGIQTNINEWSIKPEEEEEEESISEEIRGWFFFN